MEIHDEIREQLSQVAEAQAFEDPSVSWIRTRARSSRNTRRIAATSVVFLVVALATVVGLNLSRQKQAVAGAQLEPPTVATTTTNVDPTQVRGQRQYGGRDR